MHEYSEPIRSGNILGCQHGLDAPDCFRLGNVDGLDLGMRVRAAENLHVKHAAHIHVAGVAQSTGNLAGRVQTDDVAADVRIADAVRFEN